MYSVQGISHLYIHIPHHSVKLKFERGDPRLSTTYPLQSVTAVFESRDTGLVYDVNFFHTKVVVRNFIRNDDMTPKAAEGRGDIKRGRSAFSLFTFPKTYR